MLDQLRADPDALAALGEELAELRRKLPAELLDDPDGPRLGRRRSGCSALLDQVQPLLLDLLLKSQRRREGPARSDVDSMKLTAA